MHSGTEEVPIDLPVRSNYFNSGKDRFIDSPKKTKQLQLAAYQDSPNHPPVFVSPPKKMASLDHHKRTDAQGASEYLVRTSRRTLCQGSCEGGAHMLGLRKAGWSISRVCWGNFKNGAPKFLGKRQLGRCWGVPQLMGQKLEEFWKESIVDSKSAKHFAKAFISFDFCLSWLVAENIRRILALYLCY